MQSGWTIYVGESVHSSKAQIPYMTTVARRRDRLPDLSTVSSKKSLISFSVIVEYMSEGSHPTEDDSILLSSVRRPLAKITMTYSLRMPET